MHRPEADTLSTSVNQSEKRKKEKRFDEPTEPIHMLPPPQLLAGACILAGPHAPLGSSFPPPDLDSHR
jgi:hypothetical protein